MRIILASYSGLMLNKGGPTYKLIHTKKHLEKLGVDVMFHDMWDQNIEFSKDDIFHLFNAGMATYPLAKNLRESYLNYVVNPIFYSNHSAKVLQAYLKTEETSRKFLKRSYSDYYFTKFICDNAVRVLPNTIAEGELLNKGLAVDNKKMQIIHNGVEKRFAESEATLFQKKYGIKDYILYVGHLGPFRKNGKKIIQALSQIDHPSVIIADVRNNKEGEWCREALRNNKKILFIEWLDHDSKMLESAYAGAHTFILPTRYETPGRAALEAGLAGANIVITPKGGTKEYFAEFAEYPNPLSVDSIKQSIEISLNKPKTTALRERIMQNYIWEIIAKQTVKMYSEVIK